MLEPKKEETSSSQLLLTDIGTDTKSIQTESLCINCLEQGITTILLTKIPFFRDIMVSRFECPHCGYSEKSVQFGGEHPDQGVHYELHCQTQKDLNRRVVKSSECTIYVQPINLEIPGPTHGNSISTVEGILEQCFDDLQNVKQTPKIIEFLNNLEQCRRGLVNFDFVLDDPSGNSFIENPIAPEKDPQLDVSFYTTNKKQKPIEDTQTQKSESFYIDEDTTEYINTILQNNEVVKIPIACPVCEKETFISSCTLRIPNFKEVEIKDFLCDGCGYHNGQVLIKGDTSPLAQTISLKCDCHNDLNRQVVKSETASIKIPEIELDLSEGIIGGKLTTVEGILRSIHKRLKENNPFTKKDPSLSPKFDLILEKLVKFMNNEEKFTLIFRDPLSNSCIQKLNEDDENKLKIVDDDRTERENDELGINGSSGSYEDYFTGNPTFNSVLRAFKQQENDE